MKRFIILFCLLLFCRLSYCQYYLKVGITQALKEISTEKTNTNIEQRLVDDHIELNWVNNSLSCSMKLIFNKQGLGEKYYITPHNTERRISLAEYFTKNYTKIDIGRWQFFSFPIDRGISIELIRLLPTGYAYQFTLIPGINN